MRFGLLLFVCLGTLHAQMCVPARILPAAHASGTLDEGSCRLSDGTSYASYRLDLPVRGRLRLAVTGMGQVLLRNSNGARVDAGPVEAGSYTIVVNGSGDYSLDTSFAAEPGMWCTSFASIGMNQTVTGSVGVSGCSAPDGTPYEAYALSTFGSGTLKIALSGAEFTGTLMLRDEGGHLIASDASTISEPVDADSQYVIVVSGDKPGAYRLTTSFQPGEEETCRARSLSGADGATIDGDSCFQTSSDTGDLTYFNYYEFAVETAGLVELTASSNDFVPAVRLLDESGNVLVSDSGGAVRMQLTPGKYTAQVVSTNSSGGVYLLAYQFTPGPAQPCAVTASSASTAGLLATASCRTELGLSDIYSIELASAGTLELTLNANTFGATIGIRDTKDNLIAQQGDSQGLGVAHVTADLPAGKYTIVAAASSGSGSYQLTTTFSAHDVAPCSAVQPLDLNGGWRQVLRPSTCRDTDGQPMDLYSFSLPSSGTILAVLDSNQFDGLLRLTDAAGNVLRTDDNTYGEGDPLIVQYLPAGDYLLIARAASSSVGGLYQVALRTSLGDRPPFCAPKGKLTGSVIGELAITSCQHPDGTFADIYEMTLAADRTVDLNLKSANFDAYLVLLDAKGNVLAEDDDSGDDTNARIQVPLAAGTYYVVAKPLSHFYSLGTYTLSMQ